MNINTFGFMGVVAIIATIVLTFLAYKYIVPEKKRANLNKLGQFLSDVFNFKFLIIEKVLQFFYVLCTIACICGGICMIFAFSVWKSYSGTVYTDWYGLYGIAAAILGPIVIRLVYECSLLFILLVKNVIQINKKLKAQSEMDEYEMPSFKELIAKENFDFIKRKKNEVKADVVSVENEEVKDEE